MKKVTIKSLQSELKRAREANYELAKDNLHILRLKKELDNKIQIITKQSEFEQKVQNDYIESNKHIREMQSINTKMQQQSSALSGKLIDTVVTIAGNFLPMIIESINNNKKETNNNQQPQEPRQK